MFTADVTLGAASEMTVDGTTSSVTFESRFIIGQDATVSMLLTADEVTFIGSVDHGGSSFEIEGTVTTLSFPGNLQIASGSTASVRSSSENSVRVALGTIWYAIDRKFCLFSSLHRYRTLFFSVCRRALHFDHSGFTTAAVRFDSQRLPTRAASASTVWACYSAEPMLTPVSAQSLGHFQAICRLS